MSILEKVILKNVILQKVILKNVILEKVMLERGKCTQDRNTYNSRVQ